jgi:hypothetical protein
LWSATASAAPGPTAAAQRTDSPSSPGSAPNRNSSLSRYSSGIVGTWAPPPLVTAGGGVRGAQPRPGFVPAGSSTAAYVPAPSVSHPSPGHVTDGAERADMLATEPARAIRARFGVRCSDTSLHRSPATPTITT